MEHKSERHLSGNEAVRAFDERRRRAAWAGGATALFSWLITFLFYALLKSLDHQGTFHDFLALFAQSLHVGAPIFGYLVYRELADARGLLVWLRRFRPDYGDRIRFHRCLAMACSVVANPITIQDSSFTSSIFSAALRAWVIFPLLLILWVIGMLLTILAHFLVLPESLTSSGVAFAGSIAVWTALYGWAAWVVLRRMGFRTLTGRGGLLRARHRLQSLREGLGPGIGVEVLRCDDDIWKDVVSLTLSQAHIAVIDVTEPTENVLWELSQARSYLSKDSILLVCEAGTATESAAVLPEGWEEHVLMTYPAIQAPVGPGRERQYKELSNRLRQEIALRIATR